MDHTSMLQLSPVNENAHGTADALYPPFFGQASAARVYAVEASDMAHIHATSTLHSTTDILRTCCWLQACAARVYAVETSGLPDMC